MIYNNFIMKIKDSIRNFAKKSNLIKKLYTEYCKYYFKKDPKLLANMDYRRVLGENIDWDHPENLIEKIYWMLFSTDTTLWSLCADKYRVREFVIERGCGDLLNNLYGKWDRAEDIDYDLLPNEFVLKTNNSCGQVILVRDKDKLNKQLANRKIQEWLRIPYGLTNSQLHYMRIKPCVIAEELLHEESDTGHSLVDYKVWCFDGKPECVLVAYDRTGDDYKLSMFDLNWNNISDRALNKLSRHFSGADIPCPASFDIILDAAGKLSLGFPEVRVDFYDIAGKAYFGELTFSTGYGSYTKEYYTYLGSKVNLGSLERLSFEKIMSEISIGH